MYQISLYPPKSPLKRGGSALGGSADLKQLPWTLILIPLFLRRVRGDLNVLKVTAEHFSNTLLAFAFDLV
ncbi:hypothetical protein Nos7524_5043 [Nostoc sp. PCC 7524]|nr:hypothetical protein Nos7524_5043 [Nostoc sp. PCC 7524]